MNIQHSKYIFFLFFYTKADEFHKTFQLFRLSSSTVKEPGKYYLVNLVSEDQAELKPLYVRELQPAVIL